MLDELREARDRLATTLGRAKCRVVFAESCTGGLAASTMTEVPGISSYLCGSAVVYRPEVKLAWLNIPPGLIEQHSCESQPVVNCMARQVLLMTAEADWSAAIVGHLDERSHVWGSVAHRVADKVDLLPQATRPLTGRGRLERQREAASLLLDWLSRQVADALGDGTQ